jgi:hypothetical protein
LWSVFLAHYPQYRNQDKRVTRQIEQAAPEQLGYFSRYLRHVLGFDLVERLHGQARQLARAEAATS